MRWRRIRFENARDTETFSLNLIKITSYVQNGCVVSLSENERISWAAVNESCARFIGTFPPRQRRRGRLRLFSEIRPDMLHYDKENSTLPSPYQMFGNRNWNGTSAENQRAKVTRFPGLRWVWDDAIRWGCSGRGGPSWSVVRRTSAAPRLDSWGVCVPFPRPSPLIRRGWSRDRCCWRSTTTSVFHLKENVFERRVQKKRGAIFHLKLL